MPVNPNIKSIYAIWVYVGDLKRSIDFYKDTMGLKVKSRNGMGRIRPAGNFVRYPAKATRKRAGHSRKNPHYV